MFSNHVKIEPPLRAIVGADETRIDGFIGPGHVATVVGSDAFKFLPTEYNKPVVVTGFEPLDILQSVAMLIDQYLSGAVERGEARVENQYSRVVRPEGNLAALRLLDRVFSTRDTFEWRGLGWMPYSGWGFPRNSPPGMPSACTRYRECEFPIPQPVNADRCSLDGLSLGNAKYSALPVPRRNPSVPVWFPPKVHALRSITSDALTGKPPTPSSSKIKLPCLWVWCLNFHSGKFKFRRVYGV